MGKLTADEAGIILREAGGEPLEPYPGNQNKPWRARCLKCGTDITPRLVNLRFKKACSVCRGHKKHSHQSLLGLLAKKKLRPLQRYPGNTHKKWRCQCLKCGLEVNPAANALLKGQGGCWRCGSRYDDDAAVVYLVHNISLQAIKIGITNEHAHRLTKYPGWEIIEKKLLDTGKQAKELETAVLGHWRLQLGLKPKLTREQMSMKGWTETVDEIGLESAIEIIRNFK